MTPKKVDLTYEKLFGKTIILLGLLDFAEFQKNAVTEATKLINQTSHIYDFHPVSLHTKTVLKQDLVCNIYMAQSLRIIICQVFFWFDQTKTHQYIVFGWMCDSTCSNIVFHRPLNCIFEDLMNSKKTKKKHLVHLWCHKIGSEFWFFLIQ